MENQVAKKQYQQYQQVAPKSTGADLYKLVSGSVDNLFGPGKMKSCYEGIDDELRAKTSAQCFLLNIYNGKGVWDKRTGGMRNALDIINEDKTLKFEFISKFVEFAIATKFNFKYVYCFLRNSKDTASGFTLDFNMQYQAETQALANNGYDIVDFDVVCFKQLENHKFVKRTVDNVVKINFEQDDYNFIRPLASLHELEEGKNSDTVSASVQKEVESRLSDVAFSYMLVVDKNERQKLINAGCPAREAMERTVKYIEVPKDKILTSLEASLLKKVWSKDAQGGGKNTTTFNQENYKLKSGLKGMIEIATIHRVYDYLINRTREDDAEMQEANAITMRQEQEQAKQHNIAQDTTSDFVDIDAAQAPAGTPATEPINCKDAEVVETGEGTPAPAGAAHPAAAQATPDAQADPAPATWHPTDADTSTMWRTDGGKANEIAQSILSLQDPAKVAGYRKRIQELFKQGELNLEEVDNLSKLLDDRKKQLEGQL